VKIQLADDVQNRAIALYDDIKNSQMRFGRFLCEIIDAHSEISGQNCRANVIRAFIGILKIEYDTIESYVRTAERFNEDMLMEYSNVPYSVLRNTNPENDWEMDLLKLCQKEGWSSQKHREIKAKMFYEDPENHRDPIPKIQFIQSNMRSLNDDYGLPSSVLARIPAVMHMLEEIEHEIRSVPITGSSISF